MGKLEKKIETETSIFVSKLNENGLVISTEKYAVNGNSPISTTTWSYDEKNRITSETVSEAENIKKQVFIYTKVDKLAEDSEVKLLEHEAAKWLALDELDTVDWLPADVKVVKAIKGTNQT